ncbi:ABC transporter ATPase [Polaribacter sp.]|uniref:ABC transporter ATPase n=1 Tax=Polaribacter sp. TaxID=1920175 RepID=UPI0035C8438D
MFVDFKEIPEDAKVWVYPSSRKFYANEIEPLEEKVKAFISTWKQDDDTFKASYKILYNRFIVITADNVTTPLKGADIDASVSFILGLQQEYEVELLDRMNVCFKQGEFVQYKDLKDFKKLLKNKALTGKSIVFDNLITTKEDFENFWEIPIEDSWYNRFLK